MKKVGIVSCYFQPNYGSMIQALATQMALDKLGIENETIDISGIRGEIRSAKIRYFAKASLSSDILLSKMGMAKTVLIRKFSRNDYARNSALRAHSFQAFSQNRFRLSKMFATKAEMGSYAADHYSCVLAGSDQLWLPANIAADYYTLNWVPESVNTVAYATSFGQASLPRDISTKASLFLKRIRHIGVREESGRDLVKQLTGRKVPIVCDPSMLFTGEEWQVIQKEKPLVKEPYIFAYFLGNNPGHRAFVKRLKEETGCRIVALLHLDEFVKSDENFADYAPYDTDPGDFLNLIRNARYVCTDSFHGSVFSLLYEKTFFTFRRYTRKTASSTNSRLDTLFKQAGVNGRLLDGTEDVKECLERPLDYALIRKNLETARNCSYAYLQTALADLKSTDLYE